MKPLLVDINGLFMCRNSWAAHGRHKQGLATLSDEWCQCQAFISGLGQGEVASS